MIIKNNNNYSIVVDDNKQFGISWEQFDKIYCIHYLPYKERLPIIKAELKRIGIYDLDNFEFYYTNDNKYYDFLLYDRKHTIDIDTQVNSTNLNYTVNSYNLICLAYDLGYERILIIEDDVAFLKDLSVLKKYLDNFPLEYDIVNLEPFYLKKPIQKINKFYSDIQKMQIYDTGCIAISRKGMYNIINSNKQLMLPFDGYCSYKPNSVCNITYAMSNMPICIQKLYDDRQDKYISDNKYEIDLNEYN